MTAQSGAITPKTGGVLMPEIDTQSTNRLSQLLWDSVALVSFQVPIYVVIIAVSGASGRGLWLGVLGATVMMLVLGRPYGAFLNGVRRLLGLPPGGTRLMSLNT